MNQSSLKDFLSPTLAKLVPTVDGRNPEPVKNPTMYRGFIHVRWLFGISSINGVGSSKL